MELHFPERAFNRSTTGKVQSSQEESDEGDLMHRFVFRANGFVSGMIVSTSTHDAADSPHSGRFRNLFSCTVVHDRPLMCDSSCSQVEDAVS